ncbi:unnamed protein product [Bursaphelenchus xylophilus]|uniref:(pine wood nematode) hypothetical protein n=1 Tax=Bursaphelenchus xylophilus TaxID=6326 RepID=A0A1I7RM55_BURXY|nr:unnamed protein product [Bursaphelenchus xylophilus]CAG9118217.1 unnamed protein product [Bursaphelenchus xylophilus]
MFVYLAFTVILLRYPCSCKDEDVDPGAIGYLYKTRIYDFKSTMIYNDYAATSKAIKTHANVTIKYVHNDKDSMLAEYTINNCFRGPCKNLKDKKVFVELERGQVVNGLLQEQASLWDFRHSLVYALTVPHLQEVGKRERGTFPHGNCDFVHKRSNSTEYIHEIKRCDFNLFNPANPFMKLYLSSKINYFQNEKYVGEETNIVGVETLEFKNILDSTYFLNVSSSFQLTLQHTNQSMKKKRCDYGLTVGECASRLPLERLGREWAVIATSLKAVNHTLTKTRNNKFSQSDVFEASRLLCSGDKEKFDEGYKVLKDIDFYERPIVYRMLNSFYGTCGENVPVDHSLKVAELLVKMMPVQPFIATLLLRAESESVQEPNKWGYLYDVIKIEAQRYEDFADFWKQMRRFHVFKPNYLYLSQHGKAFAKRRKITALNGVSLYIVTRRYTDDHHKYSLEHADHLNVTELASLECASENCLLRVVNHNEQIELNDRKEISLTIALNSTMPLQAGPALLFNSATELLLTGRKAGSAVQLEFELKVADRITVVKNLFNKRMTISGSVRLSPEEVVVGEVRKSFGDESVSLVRKYPGITVP